MQDKYETRLGGFGGGGGVVVVVGGDRHPSLTRLSRVNMEMLLMKLEVNMCCTVGLEYTLKFIPFERNGISRGTPSPPHGGNHRQPGVRHMMHRSGIDQRRPMRGWTRRTVHSMLRRTASWLRAPYCGLPPFNSQLISQIIK